MPVSLVILSVDKLCKIFAFIPRFQIAIGKRGGNIDVVDGGLILTPVPLNVKLIHN